jgi:hypothetical protein
VAQGPERRARFSLLLLLWNCVALSLLLRTLNCSVLCIRLQGRGGGGRRLNSAGNCCRSVGIFCLCMHEESVHAIREGKTVMTLCCKCCIHQYPDGRTDGLPSCGAKCGWFRVIKGHHFLFPFLFFFLCIHSLFEII